MSTGPALQGASATLAPPSGATAAIRRDHAPSANRGHERSAISLVWSTQDAPVLPAHAARSRLKRAIDIAISAMLLAVLLPPLLLVALLVRVETPGPALFRQLRTGLGGKPFWIWKFRTMTVQESGDNVVQVVQGDKRVTRLGQLLRRTSIDELPQLINVLKGEMSIIGPRPHALTHDREFSEAVPHYHTRFRVRPGITGLAQVRGHVGPTDKLSAIQNRVEADLEYVRAWSPALDLKVVLMTLPLLLGRGAF